MTKISYEEVRKLAEEIESALEQKISSGIGYDSAFEQFSSRTGRSSRVADRDVTTYLSGFHMISRSRNRVNQRAYLERLAIFYEILGITADDEIVKKTKEIESRFEYPRESLEYTCTVSVAFGDSRLRVTPEQQNALRQQALNYALANYKDKKQE